MIRKVSTKFDGWKCGAVASLKSGGPKITVDRVEGNELVCTWFTNSGVLKEGRFQTELLMPCNSDDKFVAIMPPCPDCPRYAPADVRWKREQEKTNLEGLQ